MQRIKFLRLMLAMSCALCCCAMHGYIGSGARAMRQVVL